jgi:hypothetical protein
MPNIPIHISSLFIALVFGISFMIIIAVQVCNKRLNLPFDESRKNLAVSIIVLLAWLLFTLIIAMSGYLTDYSDKPPHILLVTLPPLVIFVLLFQSKSFHEFCAPLDNFWFVYPQAFRILVEFILWLLYRYQVIPVQMTFAGGNYDILTGLSAPFIAYYCFSKKSWSPKVALVWNFAGLLLLVNIVTIAMLSTPYSFRHFTNEPANTIPFYFPFVWLPSVVVPFALLLHLLSIKRLLAK